MVSYHEVNSSLFCGKIFVGLVLGVGSGFLLDQTLNTSPKRHLQKGVVM